MSSTPKSSCVSSGDAVVPRVERLVRELPRDALRHPGRARRVQHVHPGDPHFVERLGRLGIDGGLVALVAVDRPVEHEAQLDVRCGRDDLGGLIGLVLRRDVRPRAAVVDDVLQLGALQPGRGRGVDEAGVVAAPDDLEIAIMVLHAQRDVVTRFEPGRSQQATQPIRGCVELGEGLGEAGAGHRDGRLVAVGCEMCAGEHGSAT